MITRLPLVGVLAVLAGCSQQNTAPVEVAAPGMPNPEVQLDRAIDDVRTFLVDFNGRLPTPARNTVALQVGTPLPITAVTDTAAPEPAATPLPAIPTRGPIGHQATPMNGKGGATWFSYSGGTPHIHCASGATSLVWLDRGERAPAGPLTTSQTTGWRVNVIPAGKGVHATPAIAISAGLDAKPDILSFSTDRRSYAWVLEPVGPTMDRVRFAYHAGDPSTQGEPDLSPSANNGGASGSARPDFNYRIDGPDAWWKPLRVYAENGKTWIQFPPRGVLADPILMIVAPQQTAPQTQHVVADSLVIDGIAKDFMLTAGSGSSRVTLHVQYHGGR